MRNQIDPVDRGRIIPEHLAVDDRAAPRSGRAAAEYGYRARTGYHAGDHTNRRVARDQVHGRRLPVMGTSFNQRANPALTAAKNRYGWRERIPLSEPPQGLAGHFTRPELEVLQLASLGD